ncbi:MAG TPA: EipA family protein [Fontimonas sp.]
MYRMLTTSLTVVSIVLAGCYAERVQSQDAQPPRSIIAQGDSPAPAPTAADTPATTDPAAQPLPEPQSDQTYSSEEVGRAASAFFGETSEALAKAIERTMSDHGRPTAYIYGNEGGGALVVGLRYGQGTLQYKGGGSMPIYWQGPSVGWDFGGNASKVFTLVYNLEETDQLFQRFPAVEGSLYVVAGFGVNYQRSGDVTLAPIRSGVGLRAGANLGYIHYTRKMSVIPF